MVTAAPRYRIALPARVEPRQPAGWTAPILASLAATVVLLTNTRIAFTHLQAVLAFALVAIPFLGYADWRRTRQTQIPLFALLAAAHMVFFCLSAFWTDLLVKSPDSTVSAVLAMALVGVCALYAGMRIGVSGVVVRPVDLPDVPADPRDWWLIRTIAACQIFVPFLPVGTGGDFRQIVSIAMYFVPLVAFLILWDACLRNKGAPADYVVVVVFLASSILGGLATGWLGGCVGALVMAGIGFMRVRGRVPVIPALGVVLMLLFLQGGKSAFRERYWYGAGEAGAFTKAQFWVEKSVERLTAFKIEAPGDASQESLEAPLLRRSSLVAEAATVYENTPALVPYQYGATYPYLLVTFIPRFLWPNKPSVNDSNRFYQSAYGVTHEEDLDHVAIGAGLIPEAFMNFGWIGIPVVMCLAGLILGVFERVLLGRQAGVFASAVGLAYVLQLFSLNGQAAAYFGGMAQIIALTFLIFLPALRFHAPKRLHARVRLAEAQA